MEKEEGSFVAPVNAFVSPAELPQPKGFELSLDQVNAVNKVIQNAWDGHKADIDAEMMKHVVKSFNSMVNVQHYAELRGWKLVTLPYLHGQDGYFYRFTPK